MLANRADPPAEMKGSGTPTTGSRRIATPMFTKAWNMIQLVMPTERVRTQIESLPIAIRAPA